MAGPTDFTQVPAAGRHPRPARRSTGRATSDLGEGVMATDDCVRAWEGAYRYYGRMWELTARAPQGDPAAAREMAAASRAVAAAWRAIQAATPLPWWTLAALHSAAAAFDEQAQKYDEDSKNPTPPQDR
ncbi:MAG: hypothetical protein JO281_19090 [Pseudonocardiales bacterium]|nr:hypothetical protein [Pseudonocardiales bacterium]